MQSDEDNQYNESEDGEEDSHNYSEYITTIPIKKETFTHITINSKTYDKTISFLKEQISINASLQASLQKIKISSCVQTDDEDSLQLSSSSHLHQHYNNNSNTENIQRLTTEMLQSTNKETELRELREYVTKLKEDNKSLKKKLESFNELHTTTVAKYKTEIESLTKQLKELKEKEIDKKCKEKLMRYIIDILSNYTTANSITQFLSFDDKLSLSKTHSILWDKLYYKSKSDALWKKLCQQKNTMDTILKMDTTEYYEISENELSDIITSYIVDNKHSAIGLRYQIVNSLIFLEKNVKDPMKNYSSPEEPPVKVVDTSKKGMFFNKINSVFSSMIKGNDEEQEDSLANTTNQIPISFPKDDFKNLFIADKHILETYNTNKNVNVVFQYSKAEQIKDLIAKFFDSKLPKPTYQSFLSTIIDKFSDLLYACYEASIDIKNLEILKHALNCRVKKYRLANEELATEINDLRQFAESSKEIKEMLLKTKNECEIKYNNTLMVIQQLNEDKICKDALVQDMTEKMEKIKNDYDEKKKQMIKDFKAIQGDYSYTKTERDYLKGTLIDFKNYFLRLISEDGELICS